MSTPSKHPVYHIPSHETIWTAYNFYNALRQNGFQVEQREYTFRQPVTLGVALEIARRRPGVPAKLADDPDLDRLQEDRSRQLPFWYHL